MANNVYEHPHNKSVHKSVLLKEVCGLLECRQGDIVFDGTVGFGGHAEALLDSIGENGRYIAVDRDEEALNFTKNRLEVAKNVVYAHSNYTDINTVLAELGIESVDRILLDLGVSSYQLDCAERGFSLREDGPLDMRMDVRNPVTAESAVNSLPQKRLADIFFEYGEERYSRKIASRICNERKTKPIKTTKQLAEIILNCMPRRGKIHPATRVFQALRIFVNSELDALSDFLSSSIKCIKPTGRIAIISFHSLEDRIVKNVFRDGAKQKRFNLLTKKPIVPGARELGNNVRSRSAKLRGIEII